MGYPLSHEERERFRLQDLETAINVRVTPEEIRQSCTPSNEIVNISKLMRDELVGLIYSWAELDIFIQNKTGEMLFGCGEHERIIFVLKGDKIEVIDTNHSNGNWQIQEVGKLQEEINRSSKKYNAWRRDT